jgi:pilus assembly protein CpaC
MHRSRLRVIGLLGLLLSVLPNTAHAQLCSPEARPLIVTVNGVVRLQMTSKKAIRAIFAPKEGIVQIRESDRKDPTTVLIVGVLPGITRLELEDTDGNKETREVHVQADVEYLASQLRRAIPLGNINPIPNGQTSVILAGFVNRPEDIQLAQAIATSVGFAPINGLRVTGVQQVQLDVVMARVRRSKGRNLGFNFIQRSPNELTGSAVGSLINVNLMNNTIQTTFTPAVNLFTQVLFPKSGFQGFLEALETENLAKILAQPRLVVMSGHPASFLDGGEQAVPVPAGLGQVGVQFEEFGTRLNFLPIVLGNGRIHLEVEPEVSTLDPSAGVAIAGANVAGRATQRLHTTVELESGQTFVIGGLIQKVSTANGNFIPVLGRLPFVGVLFRTVTSVEDDAELLVLVTPHLVDAQSCDQVVKVVPGQESRTPDDFELFLEGILEAPRGPREVFQRKRYVPAHHNGPTANLFPCAPGYGAAGPGQAHGGHPVANPGLLPELGSPAPMPPANGPLAMPPAVPNGVGLGKAPGDKLSPDAPPPPPLGPPAGTSVGVPPLPSGVPPVPGDRGRPTSPVSAPTPGEKTMDLPGAPGTRP